MNRALSWFIKIWVAFAILVNVFSMISSFIGNSFWEGLGRIADTYSPFNVINFVMEIILFSPAIGAYLWLEHRRKKVRLSPTPVAQSAEQKEIEYDAGDVIEKYGAILAKPRKGSLSLITDVSELPYPKHVIKAVLRGALQRFTDEVENLKIAYISLANFQELTEEERSALAAMNQLPVSGREWMISGSKRRS